MKPSELKMSGNVLNKNFFRYAINPFSCYVSFKIGMCKHIIVEFFIFLATLIRRLSIFWNVHSIYILFSLILFGW